jgi:molecular chaperone GrpE
MKKENTTDVNVETAEASDPAQAEAVEAEVIERTDESAALKAQAEEWQQKLLRLQADFDNFRRRTRIEKEESAKYAALPVVSKLLPALDNLERAIAASKQSQDFDVLAKGVEMTARLLLEALQQEGLQAMQTVGETFNPELHQAVMQIDSDEHRDGEVVEELQRGYLLKDKVIRPAMVKVNRG